jgi:shikimate 5-dehydrogenase
VTELLGELSCISKQEGRLEGHAKDPISAGLSLSAILGGGYFGRTNGEVLIFGSGGSATALLLHLLQRSDPADRPRRVTLVDRLEDRLAGVRALADRLGAEVAVTTVPDELPPQ